MKIARFSTGDDPRYGIVQGLPDDEVASGESEGHLLVLKGDPLYSLPEATGEVVELCDARLLSPVIPRSKVVGIGKNYTGHVAEMGESEPRGSRSSSSSPTRPSSARTLRLSSPPGATRSITRPSSPSSSRPSPRTSP